MANILERAALNAEEIAQLRHHVANYKSTCSYSCSLIEKLLEHMNSDTRSESTVINSEDSSIPQNASVAFLRRLTTNTKHGPGGSGLRGSCYPDCLKCEAVSMLQATECHYRMINGTGWVFVAETQEQCVDFLAETVPGDDAITSRNRSSFVMIPVPYDDSGVYVYNSQHDLEMDTRKDGSLGQNWLAVIWREASPLP